MGPLGCLVCAQLAQRVRRHPDAMRFVEKAKRELSVNGFAKDWTLLMSGAADQGGVGWRILEALQRLKEDEIDGFLPADPPEIRATIKRLVAHSRKADRKAGADALRPVMDSLWENVLHTAAEGLVDQSQEALSPKWDPELVAASVNGMPLFRGAVRMMEKEAPNPLGSDPFEHAVAMLLAAQEMWNTGKAALPEAVQNNVFDRMRTDREREANLLRAEGEENARRIRATADRQQVEIVAEAQREAQVLRGNGDATRNAILGEAYGRDAEFFEFFRSLEAYRETFEEGTTMVLSPDSDFFRYFGDIGGLPSRHGSGAVNRPTQ